MPFLYYSVKKRKEKEGVYTTSIHERTKAMRGKHLARDIGRALKTDLDTGFIGSRPMTEMSIFGESRMYGQFWAVV